MLQNKSIILKSKLLKAFCNTKLLERYKLIENNFPKFPPQDTHKCLMIDEALKLQNTCHIFEFRFEHLVVT